MSLLQIIILALIQGLTEFLPVSSSAHLVVAPELLGWEKDQGPIFDLMAHFGTLFAVMIYFHKDLKIAILGTRDLCRLKLNKSSALALNLIISSPPVLFLGYQLNKYGFDVILRTVPIIAFATIIFGILLWLADMQCEETKTTEDLTWKNAFLLGLSQTLALIPGTSRSGITMTAGRFMKMSRVECARFSMLMSLPVIGAGGIFSFLTLLNDTSAMSENLLDGLLLAALSFLAAYSCIALFMKVVTKIGFLPFMIYRVILGCLLLIWYFI
jgi:undecaprenyl-diphosphatase